MNIISDISNVRACDRISSHMDSALNPVCVMSADRTSDHRGSAATIVNP